MSTCDFNKVALQTHFQNTFFKDSSDRLLLIRFFSITFRSFLSYNKFKPRYSGKFIFMLVFIYIVIKKVWWQKFQKFYLNCFLLKLKMKTQLENLCFSLKYISFNVNFLHNIQILNEVFSRKERTSLLFRVACDQSLFQDVDVLFD